MLFKSLLVGAFTASAFASDITQRQQLVQIVSVSNQNNSLKYFPENIQAPVGSIVSFQFHPRNHTVTESSFAEPCKPLAANLTSATRPGIRSGFRPVADNATQIPVFNILVNDTRPIWIYCGQGIHCGAGMVMVINQNDTSPNTLERYKAAAAALLVTNTTSNGTASTTSAVTQPTDAYGGNLTTITGIPNGTAVFTGSGSGTAAATSSIRTSNAGVSVQGWLVDSSLTQVIGVAGVVLTGIMAGFAVL